MSSIQDRYACEELVAELGAAFLCADLGIRPENREDNAAYLGHWLTVLKEDKRAILSAAAHAQRAADFLNSLQQQQEESTAAGSFPRPSTPKSGLVEAGTPQARQSMSKETRLSDILAATGSLICQARLKVNRRLHQ